MPLLPSYRIQFHDNTLGISGENVFLPVSHILEAMVTAGIGYCVGS